VALLALTACQEGSWPQSALRGLRRPPGSDTVCATGGGVADADLLRQAFRDPRPAARRAAVRALGRAIDAGQVTGSEGLAILADALRAEPHDADVRSVIVNGLARLGPAAAPALAEALPGPDHGVQYGAAMAIGQLGPDGAVGVPGLTALLASPEVSVRHAAVLALAEVGPAGLDGLAAALVTRDRDVQLQAIRSMGRMGSQAARMARHLKAVAEREPDLAPEAKAALRQIGPT
jgi:HEAT repeat protein